MRFLAIGDDRDQDKQGGGNAKDVRSQRKRNMHSAHGSADQDPQQVGVAFYRPGIVPGEPMSFQQSLTVAK